MNIIYLHIFLFLNYYFILASDDAALPPSMSEGMENYMPNLEKHFVDNSGHWILWEQPEKCNAILKSWLSKVYPATDAKI